MSLKEKWYTSSYKCISKYMHNVVRNILNDYFILVLNINLFTKSALKSFIPKYLLFLFCQQKWILFICLLHVDTSMWRILNFMWNEKEENGRCSVIWLTFIILLMTSLWVSIYHLIIISSLLSGILFSRKSNS